MNYVNTKEAIEIIRVGLGLEILHRTTFSRYTKEGLIPEKITGAYGGHEGYTYRKSDILKSIKHIKEHRKTALKNRGRNKKPVYLRGYNLAFNLMNENLINH